MAAGTDAVSLLVRGFDAASLVPSVAAPGVAFRAPKYSGDQVTRVPDGSDTEETFDPDAVDDTPTVSCSQCDREWDLEYELDELRVGNQALERFALDHYRHTGHFPDEISPWIVDCRQCPDSDEFLEKRPARRWARTHARHTRHSVALQHADDEQTVVNPDA